MTTLTDMGKGLEAHVAEYHAFKKEELVDMVGQHTQNIEDVKKLQEDSTLVVDLLAGEPIIDPFTHLPTGDRKPGIASRVETLEHAANGGRGLSIRTRDKLIIIGANAFALGLVAWITTTVGG